VGVAAIDAKRKVWGTKNKTKSKRRAKFSAPFFRKSYNKLTQICHRVAIMRDTLPGSIKRAVPVLSCNIPLGNINKY
jgi:hypothetical protein